MAWCFSTRASVATVLTTHPYVSRCLRVNQSCWYDLRFTYIWSRELWWGCMIKCRNPGNYRNNIMLKAIWSHVATMSSWINVYSLHPICCGEAERLFRGMIGFMASVASYVIQQHKISPDSKVHEAYMGPTWGRQDPGGPHVGPMNLESTLTTWLRQELFGSSFVNP